ncbi:MAG TPA: outer membrane lipoprotein-sorting protein [Spirochaeta sp.]|nr:outer membrane lipoprotein-sorting protein [Spirochaeta sp.]
MRKICIIIGLFCLIILNGVSAVDGQVLLKQADALVNFPETDFSAEYSIVRDVPGEGKSSTECVIFRRDSEEKYVIVITEPEINKGQGYLKQGDTLWFYDPESRKFNSTSSKNRFQNTNARNSDFTRSTLAADYDVEKTESAKLGRYNCTLLTLKANNDGVTYPGMKLWISEDGLVRKYEDYSLSGRLMRTTAIPSYQTVGKKFIPKYILIVENLEGAVVDGKFVNEKTQITITNPSLARQADSLFSKTFLENISQ